LKYAKTSDSYWNGDFWITYCSQINTTREDIIASN
jgi:hypothetical protein